MLLTGRKIDYIKKNKHDKKLVEDNARMIE
jgi:hypothetical protein